MFVLRVISAFDCGFNRSMQHLVSIRREEDVADEEVPTKDSLHRNRQSADVGSLAERLTKTRPDPAAWR